MPEIALTGGIGSGKSTVGAGLVARGATLIDADRIVRDLQEPGRPVFEAMVARWGASVVAADGTLDRAEVAGIVFNDGDELAALNAIVHPAVAVEMRDRRERAATAAATATAAGDLNGSVVVLDIPLLVRAGGRPIKGDYADVAGIVVVDTSADIAVRRLVEIRGFTEADARARVSNQASRRERLAVADFVIGNDGSLEQLEPQIEACWRWALNLGSGGRTPAQESE